MSKKEETFSDRLTKLLREKQISLRTAAKIAQVSPATLTNWTSNRSPANFHAVKRLADALGSNFTFLLLGETEENRVSSNKDPLFFIESKSLFEGYAKIQITEILPKEKIKLTKRGPLE